MLIAQILHIALRCIIKRSIIIIIFSYLLVQTGNFVGHEEDYPQIYYQLLQSNQCVYIYDRARTSL